MNNRKNFIVIMILIGIFLFMSGLVRVMSASGVNSGDISLLFVGDNMFARTIGEDVQNGDDPYKYVKDELNKYDLVVGNLETVISDKGDPNSKKEFTLRSPLKSISILKNAGFDVVSLANNHSMDFGPEGLMDMISNLDKGKIKHFGAGRNINEAFTPEFIEIDNTKIAIIGFNERELDITTAKENRPGSAWNDFNRLKKSIELAKKNSDIVILMPHWGIQYSMVQNQKQIDEAHKLIDLGADLVVGAHPHVIQGHEIYNNKHIYYSLGNFLFVGNNMDRISTRGYALEIFIKDKKIKATNIKEVKMNKKGFPIFIDYLPFN